VSQPIVRDGGKWVIPYVLLAVLAWAIMLVVAL